MKKVDKAIVVLSSSVFCALLYLVLDPGLIVSFLSDSNQREVIAHFTSLNNEVFIKKEGLFAWNQALESNQIQAYDRVSTGPSSSAGIKFDDSSIISLLENSLVIIEPLAAAPLKLKKGTLVLENMNNKKIQIEGADGPIEFSADGLNRQILVRKNATGSLEVHSEGPVSIEYQGQTFNKSESEKLTFTENAGFSVEKYTHNFLAPKFDNKSGNYSLHWSPAPIGSDAFLDISKTPDFDKIIKKIPIQNQSDLDVTAQAYPQYLRIQVDGKILSSIRTIPAKEVGSIQASASKPVKSKILSSDDVNKAFTYLKNSFNPDKNLNVFSSPFSGQGTTNIAKAEAIEKEVVRMVNAIPPKTSDELIYNLKIPGLVSPTNETSVIVDSDILQNPYFFTWESTDKVHKYQFQLSKDRSFKKLVNAQKLEENFALVSLIPKGKYYWRVRSRAGINASKWSPVREVSVEGR